jgi:hypothetical protein
MNCQGISSILDDRDIATLDDAERSKVQAHLHACADCAGDWDVQRRLAAETIPPMPATLAAQCRVAVAASEKFPAGTLGGRRTSRVVLIGSLVALAAAAAWLELVQPHAEQVLAASAVAVPGPPRAPASVVVAPAAAESVVTKTKPVEPKKAQPLGESPRFTVRVLPLQDGTQDEFSRQAVQTFYAALLDGLRAVPGLTLLQSSAAPEEIAPGEYVLTVKSDGPLQNRWSVRMVLKASMPVTGDAPGQRATVPHLFQYASVVSPACTGSLVDHPVSGCSDPRGGAAGQIDLMRQVAFPPDPVLRRAQQARLLDRTLDPAERWQALQALRVSRAVVVPGATAPRLTQQPQALDAQTLRGALDLLRSTGDPLMRKQIWSTLRGVRQAELIQPLIDASRLEASDPVRMEAVGTLAADYADDVTARTALAVIAQNDSRELVRMIAQRGLSGEASWNDYVTSRLQSSDLPDTRRLEALMYMANSGQGQQMRALLDAKSVEALSQIMPRALAALPDSAAARPADANELVALASHLSSTNEPATIDLLTGMLRASGDPMVRQAAVAGLSRHLDDARAREVLQDIAAHDADPKVREAATIRQPQLVTPPPGT